MISRHIMHRHKNELTADGLLFSSPAQSSRAAAETTEYNFDAEGSKVTDTVIVIVALLAVIMVGLMLGHRQGTLSLHPVWQVILGLAGMGVLASGARLLRLAKG